VAPDLVLAERGELGGDITRGHLGVAHGGESDEGAHKVSLDHACLVRLLGALGLGVCEG
jgi:hypothetical protein